ncbi:hypothetical protein QWY93_18960 [Echinicola jeungdonensis]|uniref:hypothetical protein n=1 Tax=Echinicola jeungdonensis TaxID=709343 RepID=UPI0025B35D95|nr:hypothetical protein [Echinicola jeungdonensis]MDN3671349.1 hypothetical protein [Echinicola jeungdonensis]
MEKGLGQLQEILDFYQGAGLKPNDFACLKTIKKVLVQQQFLLENPPSELKDRIVSLHKPYLRPIVRGKEKQTCGVRYESPYPSDRRAIIYR